MLSSYEMHRVILVMKNPGRRCLFDCFIDHRPSRRLFTESHLPMNDIQGHDSISIQFVVLKFQSLKSEHAELSNMQRQIFLLILRLQKKAEKSKQLVGFELGTSGL